MMTKLGDEFCERGLSLVGFPCNQFLFQESGDEATIKAFVAGKGFAGAHYHLMHKTCVHGADIDPVYAYLKREAPASIKWNFGAYFLVSKNGVVEAHAGVTPKDLRSRIEELLA